MHVDVALVPREARFWPDTVCVVVDQLRASSTLTTLLDLGCPAVFVTRSLAEARAIGHATGALVAGERRGLTPRGFDANNSPAELSRMAVGDRPVVLCTSNGTRVLALVRHMPVTLVGCLLNAGACADAAVDAAIAHGIGVGVVCAGIGGRFALDDAVAAGEIARRVTERAAALGVPCAITDPAMAAIRLRSAYDDPTVAFEESTTGRLVHEIGAAEDLAFCARTNVSASVPVLRDGMPMSIQQLVGTQVQGEVRS
jgi:2-phosphosulfolactate phosphatase